MQSWVVFGGVSFSMKGASGRSSMGYVAAISSKYTVSVCHGGTV